MSIIVHRFYSYQVNAAVDSMTDEKARLEAKLEEGRIEARGLENAKAAIEMENKRLLDRVNSLDDHRVRESV